MDQIDLEGLASLDEPALPGDTTASTETPSGTDNQVDLGDMEMLVLPERPKHKAARRSYEHTAHARNCKLLAMAQSRYERLETETAANEVVLATICDTIPGAS